MNKEQVLSYCTTEEQKERVIKSFETVARFPNMKSVFEKIETEEDAIKKVNELVEDYKKKVAKRQEKAEGMQLIEDAVKKCRKFGKSYQEIADIILQTVKEENNAKIDAQIEELKKKYIKQTLFLTTYKTIQNNSLLLTMFING